MKQFTLDVINIIKSIPEGKVMTYGQIARCAGHYRNARQVSYLLHSMTSKHNLPWHRVVNAKGKISLTDEGYNMQKSLLEGEGIHFQNNDSISLQKYAYNP